MLEVTYIKSLLPYSETRRCYPAGDCIGAFLPRGFSQDHGVVTVNGQTIAFEKLNRLTQDDDEIVFLNYPGDPATLAVISNVIGAAATWQGHYGDWSFLDFTPNFRLPSFGTTSPADLPPQFTGVQTTIGSGVPISTVYGKVRVGGHIIESYNDVKFDISAAESGEITYITETERSEASARRLNTRVAYGWGPYQSITDIEIDQNPIANIVGTRYQVLLGTAIQGTPVGFNESKNERTIEQAVTVAGGAIVEQTISEVDVIQISLLFGGGLFEVGPESFFRRRTVEVKVEYKEASAGSYTTFVQAEVSARDRSPVSFWVRLPVLARAKYDVRVTRITADNSDPAVSDDFVWDRMTEVRHGTRAHPGIAQIAFRQVPQEQTSVPRNYTALVTGKNNVRVYTTTTTYSSQWTDNPCWCFLDWLTDPDVGLGRFYTYDDNVDFAAALDWAGFCDDLIDNGRGGTEKRCTINIELKQKTGVQEILSMFAKAGNADIVEQGGKWTFVPHEDQPVAMVFTRGNYMKNLNLTILNTEQRPTELTGVFQNVDRDYEEDRLAIPDVNVTENENLLHEDIPLYGVTRASQVKRTLIEMLNYNRLSDEVVEFDAGYSAMALAVGQIFGLATPSGAYGVASGRINGISADGLTLTIDESVSLDPAENYEITLQHEDGSLTTIQVIPDDPQATTNEILLFSPSYNGSPKPGDVYTIGEIYSTYQKFRCEEKTFDRNYKCTVIGRKYNTAIWSPTFKIDPDPSETDGVNRIPNPNIAPESVSNLEADYREAEDSAANTHIEIDVNWSPPGNIDVVVSYYEIWYRVSGDDGWSLAGQSGSTYFPLTGVETNTTYNIKVITVSPARKRTSFELAPTVTIVIPA
jgi:predicted phage tail protein